MPFQNVETSTAVKTAIITTTYQVYDLAQLSSTNPAYGLSIQANYVFGAATTMDLALQASNDNVNYATITGTSVTVTATGMTIWDAGHPNYKYLRVVLTPDASVTVTLVMNAVNLC